MLQKIVAYAKKDSKPLLIANLVTLAVIVVNQQRDMLNATQLIKAGVLLIALFLVCKLFASAVRQHLRREITDLSLEDADVILIAFILFKELIKTSIGVCLTLVWIAGLLFFQERFGAAGLVLPVLLSLAHSLVMLLLGRLLVAGLDCLRYPQEES